MFFVILLFFLQYFFLFRLKCAECGCGVLEICLFYSGCLCIKSMKEIDHLLDSRILNTHTKKNAIIPDEQ